MVQIIHQYNEIHMVLLFILGDQGDRWLTPGWSPDDSGWLVDWLTYWLTDTHGRAVASGLVWNKNDDWEIISD